MSPTKRMIQPKYHITEKGGKSIPRGKEAFKNRRAVNSNSAKSVNNDLHKKKHWSALHYACQRSVLSDLYIQVKLAKRDTHVTVQSDVSAKLPSWAAPLISSVSSALISYALTVHK